MKSVSLSAAMLAVFCSAVPAFAAPVEARFENLGSAPMVLSKVKSCGVAEGSQQTIQKGQTSPAVSVDCGGVLSTMGVTYQMGTKDCTFNISVIYTDASPFIPDSTGYWTPHISAQGSRNATCKIVSEDISKLTTTGQFSAVFSMR